MRETGWLEAERLAAGSCPSCGSVESKPILYGMPTGEDVHSLRDRVVFAGCCLPEVLHRWTCDRCGWSWGTQQLGA